MKYIIKSGKLYPENNQEAIAYLKNSFRGPTKQIFAADGTLLMNTDILRVKSTPKYSEDVRYSEYVMISAEGKKYAAAAPNYADGDDPSVVGWPICRMPRVDHADLTLNGESYRLVMHNSQNYTMYTDSGEVAVQIFHRGITGGWNIEADKSLTPAAICGIFTFCRYMERENEFIVV